MSMTRRAVGVAGVLVVLSIVAPPGAGPAQAQPIPVTACDQTLNTPGAYQLVGNLGPCAGNGVNITASGVTFDLAGFTISGDRAACGGYVTGINIEGPISDVLVFGGTVVNFNDGVGVHTVTKSQVKELDVMDACSFGIAVYSSRRVKLIGNRVTGAWWGVRIDDLSKAILLKSSDVSGSQIIGVGTANRNKIRNNQIHGNGTDGLRVFGQRNKLLGNTVNGNAFGISLSAPASANVVRGNTSNGNVGSGIWVERGAGSNLIESNTALGNPRADLEDMNPGCDANTWNGNTFVTDLVDTMPDGGPGVGCIQ
jgi:parallel beta-helix repeat protein